MSKIPLYNESASVYHSRYFQIQRTKYQIVAQYLHEGLVIDVGVGTGIGLSSLVSQGLVVGVDGSIGMLHVAHKMVKTSKRFSEKVSLVCATVTELPFRPEIFPTIVSITVLQNLSDVKQGVEELLRISRQGGLLGLTILRDRFSRGLSLDMLSKLVEGRTTQIAELHGLAGEDVGIILHRL